MQRKVMMENRERAEKDVRVSMKGVRRKITKYRREVENKLQIDIQQRKKKAKSNRKKRIVAALTRHCV